MFYICLSELPLIRSEAHQRAGRAGRTSAGKCFRVYSKGFWEESMPEYTLPEIQRTSLTAVVLTLKCLGVHDVIRYTDAHSVSFFSIYGHRCFRGNHLFFFFFLN